MQYLRYFLSPRRLFLIAFAPLVGACAGTTTQLPDVAPELVEQEQLLQHQLALETQQRQQNRLNEIAYPIVEAATPLCGEDVAPRAGIQFSNAHAYDDQWRDAARALGFGNALEITGVIDGSPAYNAGLRVGDELVRLDGQTFPTGPDAIAAAAEAWDAAAKDGAPITVTYRRHEESRTTTVDARPTCSYGLQVVREGALNAFADGSNIVVTSAMMRFADDEELAVIISHELAHNAMGHIDAKQRNALFGALLGAMGDVAMAYSGVNTGGTYSQQGAQVGAQAYSQDFEREADYVALYALALADVSLDDAPTFWRHMAQANPSSIGLAFTHPTTAERFVRMEKAIEEIDEKQRSNEPLRPERESEEQDGPSN